MQQSIGRLVSILYRKNQVYLNMALKKHNITAAEVTILAYLFENDGAMQEELSSYMAIDKSSTARAIQSLIAKGYLHKETDPTDRRAYRVSLSDQAQDIREDIMKILLHWTDFLTDGLPQETVAVVFSALERMAQKAENADLNALAMHC